jgi:tetratricopeptide (TPR) repeat protein
VSAGAHVSALRGPAPALRSAAPDARRPVRSLRPSGPLLPLAFARGITFLALATFGALHWMAMLEPASTERGWYAVGIGVLTMGGLLGAARLAGPLRALAVAAVALAALAFAFLAAGLADELLRPDRWGELSAGISRGLDALPGARVPYRGIDAWTRFVLQVGGTLLVVAAALLAFWPRRAGRTGFPLAALILLVTLYAVPAVALDFTAEFLRGALLSLLLVAFLRLERLRLPEARGAAALAAAAAVAALVIAPALDGDSPWWDYETWALSTAASRSTAFSWDHNYGPLNWPRDGREMLRVKAKQAAYWKAESLDVFDGARWRQAPDGTHEAATYELPAQRSALDRWTQRIKVSLRNLRTRTFITAGIPVDAPDLPNRAAIPSGPPGIWLASRTLRRGDTYTVPVYTPRPTEQQLAAAGTAYDRDFSAYLSMDVLDASLPRATYAPCASSATAAAGPRRRAPSGAACGPSWAAAADRSGGCGHGGRCPRGHRFGGGGGVHSESMAELYDLFRRGTELLEAGDFNAATVPLAKARDLDPEKTSIREALGRAYFRSSQFEAARAEFEALVERAPTNDYALFCLGRALLELGRPKDARKALALAAGLRPDRRDYRLYRDRARAAA